ncbi:hypothetical protein FGL99_20220, partial [Pseudomonas putida]|nr:hypothetical protein [Pseudomonas putida]
MGKKGDPRVALFYACNQAARRLSPLDHASFRLAQPSVRWMTPASPVFAGKPAPTPMAPDHANFRLTPPIVGAGSPANQAPRWMAPASPVFAGKPAPT